MFASLFELLFKYRPLMFQQGEWALRASRPWLAIAVVCVAAACAAVTYRLARGDSRPIDKGILIAMRVAMLGLLLLCLVRPVLILRAAVPQQNFVGVLIDDSKSMTIADADGEQRAAFVQRTFGPDSPIFKALSERFVLRFFKFSSSTDRLQKVQDLSFKGSESRVGEALERANDELSGLPLAGLVVVTDGADTTDAPLTDVLLPLKAAAVPVFTVGIGRETFGKDVQVTRVETPRKVLKGTTLMVDVVVAQTGYGGANVPLQVESDGHIVSTQSIKLPADGQQGTVRVRFTAGEAGPHVFRFRVPQQTGELVPENNAREALIEVIDQREKILYFEGEPRFEVKFLLRAVADDPNLEVVLLQRTAENKYYRRGIDQPDELVAGFPKTREELFAYRGLILGSIEAAAFTGDQLRMIADFVSRRGGGLIMLGGRRAFAEGGYGGTPVEEVLPVLLETAVKDEKAAFSEIKVSPTRAGIGQAVTQIGGNEEESRARWEALPPVSTVNPIYRVKPGATVLLSGTGGRRQEQVVLAHQRYGRGKAIALPVQDSWIWQMHADIPLNDMTHETFWRQMLRWQVDGVPEKVGVRTVPDRVYPGRPLTVVADASDSTYVEVNDGRLLARITSPSGKVSEVPLDWNVERNGEYRAQFVPEENGLYELRVDGSQGDKALGSGLSYFRVGDEGSEFFDATLRTPLLQRIATDTGGRFYRGQEAKSLAEDISYTGRGVTVVEEHDLWDMPILLLLILGLVLAEWSYRRRRGLA